MSNEYIFVLFCFVLWLVATQTLYLKATAVRLWLDKRHIFTQTAFGKATTILAVLVLLREGV